MAIGPQDWCNPAFGSQPSAPSKSSSDLVRPDLISTLCLRGWRPILIDGFLRDILIRHFADPINIEDIDIKPFIWKDDASSAILIESIFRFLAESAERRPAIIIKPNSIQNLRLAIADGGIGVDHLGRRMFNTFWVGSHTLFCIGGSGGASQILATEAQRQITEFAPCVVARLELLRLQVVEVGSPVQVVEAREDYATPVTVGWAYQESWVLEQETVKTRDIMLSSLIAA
jgi:hypothetical protein